jgi:hypothetical protein
MKEKGMRIRMTKKKQEQERRVIGEDEEVSTPTREEVEKCIRKTKNNKAPGEYGITAELIKYEGEG